MAVAECSSWMQELAALTARWLHWLQELGALTARWLQVGWQALAAQKLTFRPLPIKPHVFFIGKG